MMKDVKLDSILLFALVIPFIMTYRISPGETPYALFGIIFLGLLLYIVSDILRLDELLYHRIKHVMLWLLIIVVIGSAFVSAIIVRHQTAPVYMIHDIVLQQESAIRFLLDGKNPYAVTYFGTPLEQWHYSITEVNPALYHFVMEPFYLLFSLPFYVVANTLFGFFDGRMPLLFLFFSILVLASYIVKDQEKKRQFLILLAFNPAMLGYTLEGRSDIFMYAFLFASFVLLLKKKYVLSAIPMALAFAVKQSVWPLFPFYIALLFFKLRNGQNVAKVIAVFIAVFVLIVAPFFFWDKKAFLDSTIFYLSGATEYSYPISGYGFGMLLSQLGVINDVSSYYPFHIWQSIIGLPVLIVLIRFLRRNPSVKRLILVYTLFLFVFWYFSRYFNNSHLGYLSLVFITTYVFPANETDI